MQGTQTVSNQSVQGTGLSEFDWSEDEDPEHRFWEGLFAEPGHAQLGLLSKNEGLAQEWLSPPLETSVDHVPIEDAATLLDSTEFSEALEDLGFRSDLKRACQGAFYRYSQSTHSSWEDLQQEVLMRFGNWLPRYRKEANRKTVFARIATNVLIDAHRRETTRRRLHEEVTLEDLEFEPVGKKSGTEIEDRIFIDECRSILSDKERSIFDEYFVYGKSLRQLAIKNGVSAAAMSKRWARIIDKIAPSLEKPSRNNGA